MNEFFILVDVAETTTMGYFISFHVVARSELSAERIVNENFSCQGLSNFTIVEIEKGSRSKLENEGILTLTGKTYYGM